VVERAAAMQARLDSLRIPAKFGSDLAVAKALIAAGRAGALENVRINLESILDARFRKLVEERIARASSVINV
jgi:formiminotetrahydrofolate cyclodeaminase